MTDTLPLLNYWAKRLGWLSLSGAILGILALTFYATLGKQADQQLHEVKREIAQIGSAKGRPVWLAESPQIAQQNYYRALPSQTTVTDLLEKIFDAAYENDTSLEQGKFKQTTEQGVSFSQYQIEFPVTGGYPEIRKFVNQVLLDIPTIALDSISFSRGDTKNPELDAKVRFTLYLKAEK